MSEPTEGLSPSAFIESRKQLKSAIPFEEATFQLTKEMAKARCKTDFNFYAGLLLGAEIMESLFPPFYARDLFGLLTKEDDDPFNLLRFALGLPRGFVKTTFCKIITCYLIHFDYSDFVVVCCASEGLAINFINDVDEMLANPQVENIFGKWSSNKVVDNAKAKIGRLDKSKQPIILIPKGAGSSVRGINIYNRRPDLIICDDIQTRESALSSEVNESLIDWFTGTFLKIIRKRGVNRRVIFLGNMYPGECLLKKLKDNPAWTSLITGAILEDGESLWPELQSVPALIEEYKHDESMGRGHIWFAEVQNDPLDARYRLLSSAIPSTFDHLHNSEPDACFLTIDPAGFRKTSDDNVIACHKVFDQVPVCTSLKGGQWDPQTTVINILDVALTNGASVIGIESVGYQQSLLFWVTHFLKKMNISGIHVVELKTRNATKLSRIRDYISELLSGTAGMTGEARAIFAYYASLYKIEKTDNRDDYLDAPAYAKQIITEHGRLLTPRAALANSLENLPKVVSVNRGI